jgi:mannan endo-1,4-beta-mannosidase
MLRRTRAVARLRAPSIVAALVASVTGAAAAQAHVVPGSLAQRSNVAGLTKARYMDAFVVRHGSRLFVNGRPFRWSGGNVEWLGLENYGPDPSTSIPVGSERYATPYEINDAFATLHEMGASVARIQTLGDTVGCLLCEEPKLGQFNEAAFHETDLVVAAARRWGIKLIGEFDGDANGSEPAGTVGSTFESHNWYCEWEDATSDCGLSFFSGPKLITDYEQHMRAVLDHVNPYTGLAYREDPTILGWVDGNNLDLTDGVPPTTVANWLSTVSTYYKSIDPNQLFIDISLNGADAVPLESELKIPGVDIFAQEYYPHWFPGIDGDRIDGTVTDLHVIAAEVATAGKAYATIEYGWDHTNFLTQGALSQFLAGLYHDQNVVGDDYWALAAHANGHGWQPIPADAGCSPTCEELEDGNWWALYYTGVTTLSNAASDMAQRAQVIRAHAYEMDGYARTPPHEIVPAPIITSLSPTGKVLFEGSAGSPDYTVQKLTQAGTWSTPCHLCTTDADGGWQDPADDAGCYRVIPVNLGGVLGPASESEGYGCPKPSSRRSGRQKETHK